MAILILMVVGAVLLAVAAVAFIHLYLILLEHDNDIWADEDWWDDEDGS
jgi:hypothetical protein